jgi:DNA end-binding protein Ku
VAPRANWKGFLKVADLSCPVSLYTAVSTSEHLSLHVLNRATGHRVRRQFIDQETQKPVDAEDQVKGYEVSKGEYVVLEPAEIAAALPESDKTLSIEAFVPCNEIDDVYFDRPYYLAPSNPVAEQAFAVLREGMRAKEVAAIARTMLFRRARTLLIRPYETGLIATTLDFDYEGRSAKEAFAEIPMMKIKGEMRDLAIHIIKAKKGKFDPKEFEDRYEKALAAIVKAKLEGRPAQARKAPAQGNVVDLMQALRESAKGTSSSRASKPSRQAPNTKASKRKPSASHSNAATHRSARRKAS